MFSSQLGPSRHWKQTWPQSWWGLRPGPGETPRREAFRGGRGGSPIADATTWGVPSSSDTPCTIPIIYGAVLSILFSWPDHNRVLTDVTNPASSELTSPGEGSSHGSALSCWVPHLTLSLGRSSLPYPHPAPCLLPPEQRAASASNTSVREVDRQRLTLDVARANLMRELTVLEGETLQVTWLELETSGQSVNSWGTNITATIARPSHRFRWWETWRVHVPPMPFCFYVIREEPQFIISLKRTSFH